ncbi:MAG: hypothetical protein M3Q07_07175, partial [Pseudobdellovibrionaceae bacterium]|nr:hypothetical protein [Pseudobdellovibrionaceae bacterium]
MNVESYGLECRHKPVKTYLLNQSDRFIWFSPEWNLEFRGKSSETYEVNDFIGKSFFDLLAGPIMGIYRSLFQLVRKPESQTLDLTMRCDRFPFKILMRQELTKGEDGQIRVQLAYVSCEALDEGASRTAYDWDGPLRMCSWCQSIYDERQGLWVPLEKSLGYLPLLH